MSGKGWQGSHRGFVRNVVVGAHLPDVTRPSAMPLPKQTRDQDIAALDKTLTEEKTKALAFRAATRRM